MYICMRGQKISTYNIYIYAKIKTLKPINFIWFVTIFVCYAVGMRVLFGLESDSCKSGFKWIKAG